MKKEIQKIKKCKQSSQIGIDEFFVNPQPSSKNYTLYDEYIIKIYMILVVRIV